MKVDLETLDKNNMAKMLEVGRSRLHELMNEHWFPKPLLVDGKCRWSLDQAIRACDLHNKIKCESKLHSLCSAHQSRVGNSFIGYIRLRKNIECIDGIIIDKKLRDRTLHAIAKIHVLECRKLGIEPNRSNLSKTIMRINEKFKAIRK